MERELGEETGGEQRFLPKKGASSKEGEGTESPGSRPAGWISRRAKGGGRRRSGGRILTNEMIRGLRVRGGGKRDRKARRRRELVHIRALQRRRRADELGGGGGEDVEDGSHHGAVGLCEWGEVVGEPMNRAERKDKGKCGR
jgi:hypothetical protein